MLTVFSALNFVAWAVMWLFAFVVYQGGPDENTRSYARYVGWTGLWALAMAIFLYLDPVGHPIHLVWAVKFIYWVGTTIATSFFYFSLVYPDAGNRYLRVRWFLIALNSILFATYFGTDLIISGVTLGEKIFHRFPIYGPLWWPLFNGIFTFFLYAGFFILFRKWRAEKDPAARRRHAYLFWSAVIAFTPGVLLAVIFIALAKNFDYYWISPTLTLIWVIFVSYAIFRHKLFNIRVIATELAVLLLGIILFLNIFIDEIGRSFSVVTDALTGGISFDISIYTLLIWTAALIVAIFGVAILASAKRSSSKMYALATFAVAVWGAGLGIYYLSPDTSLVTLVNKMNHGFGNVIALFFFAFAYMFPDESLPRRRTVLAIALAELALIGAYVFSDAIVGQAFVRESILDRGWELGPYAAIFYLHFFLLTTAAFFLLWKKYLAARGTPESSHILIIMVSSAIGFSLGGATGVILPMLGYFTYLWTGPLSVLFWVAATAFTIIRYGTLSVRLLASELFIFVLVILLFGNIFVTEFSVSLHEQLFPLQKFGALPIIIWLVSAVLASHTLVLLFSDRRPTSRALTLTFAAATAWSVSVGGFYAADTIEAATVWARYFNYFGGHLVVASFFLFAYLTGTEKWPSRRAIIAAAVIEPFVIYAYLFSDLVSRAAVITGFSVFDRDWVLGPLGILHHLQIAGFVLGGLFIFWKRKNEDYPYETAERIQESFRALGVIALPAVVAFVVVRFAGFVAPNWLGPFFALAWAVVSAAVIIRYRIGNIRLFAAEVLVLATLIVLLANIFITEATFAFFARLGVFLAFVAAGIAFIYNVLKGERQRNELDTLTIKLADLNKNLESIVEERTEEIRLAAERTTTVIENLHNGVIEYTKDGVIRRMNSAAERLLGTKRETAVGTSAAKDGAALAAVSAALPNGTGEVRIESPIVRELAVTLAPLGETGGTMRVLRDITREKIVSRSKTEFISIAAHQLRTPLSVIKWTLDLFLAGDLGKVTERQREHLARADATNERLITLVNDLLGVSRIDSGNEEYEFDVVDAALLAKDALHDLAPLASSKRVRLVFEPPTESLLSVRGDATKLRYVLSNAVHNAIMYNKPDGSVTATVLKKRGGVAITIADTGIGIPAEHRSRLFTKFFRTEQAVKIHTEGTGLSLFIMKHIMERHGGDIAISSRRDAGTTVTLFLPADRNRSIARPNSRKSP